MIKTYTLRKMMNLLALGLVVSTLSAAGVLTPPGNPTHHHSDQVLREGHRVIVVEYEREISADHSGTGVGNTEGGDAVKALSESTTKEKVCDAFGVCRDKISGAASGVGHAVKGVKDKVSGVFHHGKEKMSDAEESVKHAKDVTKDKLYQAKEATKDKASEGKDATKDTLSRAKDATKDKLSQAKDATMDKLSQAKEVTKDKLSETGEKTVDMMTDAKESAKDKLSRMKKGVEDEMSKAKGKIGDKLANTENDMIQAKEKAKEKLSEMGEEVKDKASVLKDEIKEVGEKAGVMAEDTVQNLTDIVRRARDVAYDMASYVASPRTSRTIWAVVQLLGFATAYGTCVWVTFISSHVLSSALPRQQFGMVHSKVYPVYFRAVAYGVSIAFLAQYFGRSRGSMAEKLQTYNLFGALGMVLVNMLMLEPTATKLMFERMKAEKEEGRGLGLSDMVEPVPTTTTPSVTGLASVTTTTATTTATDSAGPFSTTKSTSHTEMQNEGTAAVENKLKSISMKLRKWNSYSSLVNVLTLMSLTWHLAHLARLMSCCQY